MGLPYGVLKKVELARTLMSNPRMIILDEPAAGLNDAETEELTEIIRLIRDDFHCTIFLVEHDMNLVMDCVRHRLCYLLRQDAGHRYAGRDSEQSAGPGSLSGNGRGEE